jgi:hypothetical protein
MAGIIPAVGRCEIPDLSPEPTSRKSARCFMECNDFQAADPVGTCKKTIKSALRRYYAQLNDAPGTKTRIKRREALFLDPGEAATTIRYVARSRAHGHVRRPIAPTIY